MRPRVIPADDWRIQIGTGGKEDASMRPRVIPADDLKDPRVKALVAEEASMRPRVIPADDGVARA